MADVLELTKLRGNLRREAMRRRDEMTEPARLDASAKITAHVERLLESTRAKLVHCYLNIKSEVSTRTVVEWCLNNKIGVVVPIVVRGNPVDEIVHSRLYDLHHLRVGNFGVEEPADQMLVGLAGVDTILVPLVGFDHLGNRLGYGGGFYDRILKDLGPRALRVGLAFTTQEVTTVPTFPHDEPLDLVVTDDGVIDCRRSRQSESFGTNQA